MPPDIMHQGEFYPLESPLPELVKGDPKIAFGRVVMPYFLKLKPEDYTDIRQDMIEAADPIKFRPYLFPTEGEYTVDGIALSSAEYGKMVRYPGAFGKAVNNATYQKRRNDGNVNRRRTAADQEEIDTLTSKLPSMQAILRGVLLEKQKIKLLSKESRSPGYAHVSTRVMREAAIYTHDVTFKRILEVVGREKSWTQEQASLASRSMDARLFFSRAERVGNWRSMLKLADEYGRRRERLFQGRIDSIERILGRISTRASQ